MTMTTRAVPDEQRDDRDDRLAAHADPSRATPPTPNPEAASDARIERMDRVALLYAEITAATRAFLAALAESDRHRDWTEEGFGSCAEWLAWRLGITRNTANEKVRVARALERLPRIADAMGRGALSFSKVRALTRVATPDNEAELLDLARAGSAARLERLVRSWRDLDPDDEARRERVLHRSRSLSVFPGEDGMYVVRGRLTPEIGAVLLRAIEAAGDALYRREAEGRHRGDGRDDLGARDGEARGDAERRDHPGERDGERGDTAGCDDPDELDRRQAARRRADAVGLLAERALAAGFGHGAPVSGSRAERYQVILHVEAAELRGVDSGDPDGSRPDPARAAASATPRPHFEDGTPVTAVTARRMACDAARVDVHRAHDGSVLSVGRRTRTVPPALRRALEVRDRGCRFPGCGLRFTDAHHIVHWADGGETSLRNLVLLCRRHHRAVHEGRVRACSDLDGNVVFFTPDGRTLFEAPPAPASRDDERDGRQRPPADSGGPGTASPASPLLRRNRARGVRPGPDALRPTWLRDQDIPWRIEAAAWEALDPPDIEDSAA